MWLFVSLFVLKKVIFFNIFFLAVFLFGFQKDKEILIPSLFVVGIKNLTYTIQKDQLS